MTAFFSHVSRASEQTDMMSVPKRACCFITDATDAKQRQKGYRMSVRHIILLLLHVHVVAAPPPADRLCLLACLLAFVCLCSVCLFAFTASWEFLAVVFFDRGFTLQVSELLGNGYRDMGEHI